MFQSRGIRSDNAVKTRCGSAPTTTHCFNPVESGLIMLSSESLFIALKEEDSFNPVESGLIMLSATSVAEFVAEEVGFQSRGIRSDNAVLH